MQHRCVWRKATWLWGRHGEGVRESAGLGGGLPRFQFYKLMCATLLLQSL